MSSTHDLTYYTGFDPRPRPAAIAPVRSFPIRPVLLVMVAVSIVFSPWVAMKWLAGPRQPTPAVCAAGGGANPANTSLAARRAALEAMEAGADGACR